MDGEITAILNEICFFKDFIGFVWLLKTSFFWCVGLARGLSSQRCNRGSCCGEAKVPIDLTTDTLWSYIRPFTNALPEWPKNAAQLRDAVHDQWWALRQSRVKRLVHNLHCPIPAGIEAGGGHIPYWRPYCCSASLVTSLRINSLVHIFASLFSYVANEMLLFHYFSRTVKPGYNYHLMGYFSAFWSSSRWPRAT